MKHDQIVEKYRLADPLDRAPISTKMAERVFEIRRQATKREELATAIEAIETLLTQSPGQEQLLFALFELMERLGTYPDMHKNWEKMTVLFPDNEPSLRMHLRWLRRQKRSDEGLALIEERYSNRLTQRDQAVAYLAGLRELKLRTEIDDFIDACADETKDWSTFQIIHMRVLLERESFAEAGKLARRLSDDKILGDGSKVTLDTALEYARISDIVEQSGAGSAAAFLVLQCKQRRLPKLDATRHGSLSLYTGQLAAGGAERQFARIAVEFQKASEGTTPIDGKQFVGPVHVCVHHADKKTAKDFFRPFIEAAGIQVDVLDEMPEESDTNPFAHLGDAADVFRLLPKHLRHAVSKLSALYRKTKPETAYIWQDSGIRTAGLAALAAEVPRIVLCYRSTPSKIRKDFYRPGFDGYFEALSRTPAVFTACNSQIMASKYADWLDLPLNEIAVIQNAATKLDTAGTPTDAKVWAKIQEATPECRKTVVGLFRLHPVKRATVWVSLAEKYLATASDTRFVIVGGGEEDDKIRRMISERGLEDRVFLAGRSKAVGFWLSNADLILHCARHEGLPNAILEAQLAERAVLATPAGGTQEAMISGKTGVCLSTVEPFPYDEALAELTRMLDDANLREEMGRKGKAFVEQEFSMQRSLSRTMELITRPVGA